LLTNNAFVRTSDEFPLLLNVSKPAQFLCLGFRRAHYHGRITRLTEHDDVIRQLLRGAPRLCLALGAATARAGPD